MWVLERVCLLLHARTPPRPVCSYARTKPMRHFPACCSDCQRLWLVSTAQAPSASPVCPRCGERGRLVPGAYYSDPGAAIFERLEAAVQAAQLSLPALLEL